MRETRSLRIQDKVFSKSDLLNLATIMLDERKKSEDVGNQPSITFSIHCADNTSYESDSIELLQDGKELDLKRTLSIQMSFYDYRAGQKIDISLVQGNGDYQNYLEVSGNDRNWVGGVFTRLTECVAAVKPQKSWVLEHKTIVLHTGAVAMGIVGISLLNFLFPYPPDSTITVSRDNIFYNYLARLEQIRDSAPWAVPFIRLFLYWLAGLYLGYRLRAWLLKLWPKIEFDFGPEHLKLEKLRRIRLATVLSVIVIPIVLRLVYDVSKTLTMR